MADKNSLQDIDSGEEIIAKAKDFWSKYGKLTTVISSLIIVGIGGWYAYQNFFQKPKEAKAAEAMYKAEEYYRMDSVNLALNGDGQFDGAAKISSKYSGTDAATLANFYAGVSCIKNEENEKAIQYLQKVSTSSKPLQARVYKLLGDAYGDLGKNADALNYYKKSAHHFEADEKNSAEALFLAAYLADRVMKDPKQAIALYKELKEKYPNANETREADNYLAQLGEYQSSK